MIRTINKWTDVPLICKKKLEKEDVWSHHNISYFEHYLFEKEDGKCLSENSSCS